MKFVTEGPIDNKSLILVTAWCWTCNKPLSETILPHLTDAYMHHQGQSKQGQKFLKISPKFKFPDSEKIVTRDTPSNDSDHLCQI